jgi:hypothetical protein
MAKKRIDVEPTPEDFDRIDRGVEDARENLRYLLAKRYAAERVRSEFEEQRRARLRRLTFGLLGR